MKTLLQSLIFLSFWSGISQTIYIPDATFKQLMTQSTTAYSRATAADGSYIKVDANNDGEIDASEVTGIFNLYLGNSGITNLTGILAFSNLRDLRCDNNMLNTLDVSGLVHLRKLDCSYDNLSNLNIDGTVLQEFDCNYNNLTSITYSQLQNVTHLNISDNNLGPSIILSSDVLPVINSLNCSGNALTNLNITNASLNILLCINNMLTSLNTSGMPNMGTLQCDVNQISALDFSSNSFLWLLSCNNNQLTTLELNSQHYLNTVFCPQNPLQSIYIKNGSNESIYLGSGMTTTLQYICADETQLSAIQSTLTTYGYSSCSLNSNCSLSADDFNADDDLVIYPNPAENFLNILIKNADIETVEAYNLLGQLVFTKVCPCETVNIDSLHSGVYNLIIKSTSGIFTKRFLKS